MKSVRSTRRLLFIVFAIIMIIGLVFIAADLENMVETVRQADWRPIPAAFLVTLLAYGAMSISFGLVGRLFDVQMRQRDLAAVGFVTNVINHVVTTGGVAGYTIRVLMMARHGVSLKDVAAVSIVHFYLTSLDMMIMLPVSLAYLLRHAQVKIGITVSLIVLIVILASLAIISAVLITSQKRRLPALQVLNRKISRFTKRDFEPTLVQFDQTMTRGVTYIRRSPEQLLLIQGLTWIDWVGSVLVLGFCLDAFGPPVPFGVMITGFVIGVMTGLLSMIPGGIGVQEGSMTGVFTLLGVPLGQAVLGAVLFRGIFYFFPYLVSLVLSRWLIGPIDPSGKHSSIEARDADSTYEPRLPTDSEWGDQSGSETS